jgi:hypothetical protein
LSRTPGRSVARVGTETACGSWDRVTQQRKCELVGALVEKSSGASVAWAATQPPAGERLTEQIHPRRDSDRDQIRWQESKRRSAHRKLETERLTQLGDWARLGSGGQTHESYRWPVLINNKSGPAHKNETERRLTGARSRRDTKICRQQEKNQERTSGHQRMNGN